MNDDLNHINRFLPEDLWVYGNLFWEARKQWVDIDDDIALNDFLETQDITSLYLEDYFKDIQIPQEELEEIQNEFTTIFKDSENIWVSLVELFFYKYLPEYIPDWEYFRVTRTNHDGTKQTIPNGCGWHAFQKNIDPSPKLCIEYSSNPYDRKIRDWVTTSFWYDDGEWNNWYSFGLKKEYTPWSTLVMHNFYGYSDGTHLPVETNVHFLAGKNNGHIDSLISGKIEFILMDSNEGKLSKEEREHQNIKIQHLQKLCLWHQDIFNTTIKNIRKCKSIIESNISPDEHNTERWEAHWTIRPRGLIEDETEQNSNIIIWIIKKIKKTDPVKKRKHRIRESLRDNLKSQYFIVA